MENNVDKEVLLQAIKDAEWNIEYHKKHLQKHEELLKIYNNQLTQLN